MNSISKFLITVLSSDKVSKVIKFSSTTFLILEIYLLCETLYKSSRNICTNNNSSVHSEMDCLTLEQYCVNSPDKLNELIEDTIWNTVLFFPDFFPTAEDSTTNKLIWYLKQAKQNIKFCLFSVSFTPLERALQSIVGKGVNIQAVVHNPGSGRRLSQRGIKTKVWKQSVKNPYDRTATLLIDLMHHKFFVIDEKIVINGSLNWTREGISGNYENILITNNKRAVQSFITEFDKLWFASELQIPKGGLQLGRKLIDMWKKQ